MKNLFKFIKTKRLLLNVVEEKPDILAKNSNYRLTITATLP